MKSLSTDTTVASHGRINAVLSIEMAGPDGDVVIEQPLHSFVKNFAQCVRSSYMGQIIDNAVTDTNGTLRKALFRGYTRTISYAARYGNGGMQALAPAGTTTHGIVVGSSSDAFSVNDYRLHQQISHGAGVGSLLYGETTEDDAVAAFETEPEPRGFVRITRPFSNASVDNVPIREVGLAYRACVLSGDCFNALISRDVLDTPVTVPAGESILVTYKIVGGL